MAGPLAYRPEEGAQELGISRAKMFELLKSGAIDSIKIGRSRRIPHDALTTYIDGLRTTPRGSGDKLSAVDG